MRAKAFASSSLKSSGAAGRAGRDHFGSQQLHRGSMVYATPADSSRLAASSCPTRSRRSSAHGAGRTANEPAASHLDQGHLPLPIRPPGESKVVPFPVAGIVSGPFGIFRGDTKGPDRGAASPPRGPGSKRAVSPPPTGSGSAPTGAVSAPTGAGSAPTGAVSPPTGAGSAPTGAGSAPTGAVSAPNRGGLCPNRGGLCPNRGGLCPNRAVSAPTGAVSAPTGGAGSAP